MAEEDKNEQHLTSKRLSELTANADPDKPSLALFWIFELLEWAFYGVILLVVFFIGRAIWESASEFLAKHTQRPAVSAPGSNPPYEGRIPADGAQPHQPEAVQPE